MDGCMDGGINVRQIDPVNELMIMNDFQSNVNLVVNGEALTQDQLVSKYYYSNEAYKLMQNNEFVVNKAKPFKKEVKIPEEPRPIEPGQVDPATFFGSSMKGLF